MAGASFIGIYDEPPSQHVDYVKYDSCDLIRISQTKDIDYIEEVFNKHYKGISEVRKYKGKTIFKPVMTIEGFRAAVKDIEADHLKKVCQMR